jgi:hypothetical protein
MQSKFKAPANINSANSNTINCQIISGRPIYNKLTDSGIEYWAYIKTGEVVTSYNEFRLPITMSKWPKLTNQEKLNYRVSYAHMFKNLAELIMHNRQQQYEIINKNSIPSKSKIKTISMKKDELKRFSIIINNMEEGRIYDVENDLVIYS